MRSRPNMHPNPLSGHSEDCPDDEDLDDWQGHPEDPDEEDTAALLWQQELESHL